MRVLLSIILITVLIADQLPAQEGQADRIKQEVSGWPASALVEVSMTGGGIVRGHIVSRTDTDFSLRREKSGGIQNIAYAQVLSVSQIKSGHSHKKWIILGVVVGAMAVAVIVIVVIVKTKGPFAL